MDTTPTLPTLGTGLPVPLGEIDLRIKQLWEQSGNVASRASLMNLAVYCEGGEAMKLNTARIGRISQDHPCRGILIGVEPGRSENRVQAWISAHCHLTRAGAKQTCCEQITFQLDGPDSQSLIPSIVFSHLDSDLPLYLWWQGEFPRPLNRQLWTWVDRLIFDSNQWRDQCAQLELLRESLKLSEMKSRIILCDLNWARSLYFRQAVSSTFDHPGHLPSLGRLDRVQITHGPGYRSTALLFLGWLASRLKWRSPEAGGFLREDGTRLETVIHEAPGAPLGGCELAAGNARFRFFREADSAFLHSETDDSQGHLLEGLFPAGGDTLDDLVDEELSRGGRHRVYLQALSVAETLF